MSARYLVRIFNTSRVLARESSLTNGTLRQSSPSLFPRRTLEVSRPLERQSSLERLVFEAHSPDSAYLFGSLVRCGMCQSS